MPSNAAQKDSIQEVNQPVEGGGNQPHKDSYERRLNENPPVAGAESTTGNEKAKRGDGLFTKHRFSSDC